MYAIICDGGKQYSVSPGQSIDIEKKNFSLGQSIDFADVVYYSNEDDIRIGTPMVKDIVVKGVVEKHEKGPKLTIFKFRRRKDSRCKKGHRQQYTRVKILEVNKT